MTQEVLTLQSRFHFDCHKGLSCYTQCCREVNIWLLPYDVLRMKNALGISSEEFLMKYTLPRKGRKGMPVVLLKMQDNEEKTCPFVTPDGCTIYPDRPWPCRAYPISQTEKDGEFKFVKFSFCKGFEEEREWTIEEWINDQGLKPYLEMEKAYRMVTESPNWDKIPYLKGEPWQMFYMACYNVDKFKTFVKESPMFKRLVPQDRLKQAKEDEIELLKLAFDWVRFAILGEPIFEVK